MEQVFQHTIKSSFKLKGYGLHSGKDVNIEFLPAKENSGIVFQRVDLKNSPTIKADINFVNETFRGTTIKNDKCEISTVEHLLATLYTLKISNILIKMDSFEPPALDGSGIDFYKSLIKSGIEKQESIIETIKIDKKLIFKDKDSIITIEPSDKLEVDYTIVYNHPFIETQNYIMKYSENEMIKNILPCRTFGWRFEGEFLQKKGLALGSNVNNTLILEDDGTIANKDLRFEKEFVKHKILDLIGDLSLLNKRIVVKIKCYKTGHRFHINLGKKIFENIK